jgi:hypothetical protein
MGYSIDSSTATALIENCGFDASLNGIGSDMMEMAIYRLIMCLPSNKKQINMEDVELSVFKHENFIVWDILNAIDSQDYDKCINLIHKASKVESNVVQSVASVMNTLLWKFRLLLFLKDKIALNKDISKAGLAALEMRKLRKQGSGYSSTMNVEIAKTGESAGQPSPCWSKMVIQQCLEGFYGKPPSINVFSRRDIYRIIRSIQHAVHFLRISSSEKEAFLLSDIVFMTICKTLDDKHIKQIMQSFEKAQV